MKVKNQKTRKKNEFRRNKTNGHPAYIYERVGNKYNYIGITHAEKTKGAKNIQLDKNPNPADTSKAYLRPVTQNDSVNRFKKKQENWAFTKSDKAKAQQVINNKKRPHNDRLMVERRRTNQKALAAITGQGRASLHSSQRSIKSLSKTTADVKSTKKQNGGKGCQRH